MVKTALCLVVMTAAIFVAVTVEEFDALRLLYCGGALL